MQKAVFPIQSHADITKDIIYMHTHYAQAINEGKPLVVRIDQKQEITMKIPFHFINAENAPGIKLANGMINHAMSEVEIRCLPKDLPEYVVVDLGKLEAGAGICY